MGEKGQGSPILDAVVRSETNSLLNEEIIASKQQKTWPPHGRSKC
jgi:hypothetical protein